MGSSLGLVMEARGGSWCDKMESVVTSKTWTEEQVPGDSQQQMAGVVSMATGGLPFTCACQASRPPSPSPLTSGSSVCFFPVCVRRV